MRCRDGDDELNQKNDSDDVAGHMKLWEVIESKVRAFYCQGCIRTLEGPGVNFAGNTPAFGQI